MIVNVGGHQSDFHLLPNRSEEELLANVKDAFKHGLPMVTLQPPTDVPAVLVGGGPSLNSTIETIRHMKECGAKVFAMNNAASFLVENGIRPDYQVLIDSRDYNVKFFEERWAGEALLQAQVHPEVFNQCERIGYPVKVFYPLWLEDEAKDLAEKIPTLIWSGWTVGLTAMALAQTMGHRELHLFGYDSCHREKKSHAYEQEINKDDQMTTAVVDGRVFECSIVMAAQAAHFEEVCNMLANHGCTITVHGEGLIPLIAKLSLGVKTLTAVYDLGVAPPTFDFLTFLSEADKARKEGNYEALDIVFEPGPMNGFRLDNLPPSVEIREGMLHRVCVAACRLLPGVRSVSVLKTRKAIEGDVFPKNYQHHNHQLACYGAQHFKTSARPLRATKEARDQIAKLFPTRYATITLRECDYWPERNSIRVSWDQAARELQFMGIKPVIVPDFNGKGLLGFETFAQASVDLDLRLALYEKAEVNLGVMNGPMALCFLSECRYIVWKPVIGRYTDEMYTRFGINPGDQYGPNGWVIWEEDTPESVLKGIADWFKEKKVANA